MKKNDEKALKLEEKKAKLYEEVLPTADINAVEEFLKNNKNFNLSSNKYLDDFSALHVAIYYFHVDEENTDKHNNFIKQLIEKFPELMEERNGADQTPLMYASAIGDITSVKLLIELGSDAKAVNKAGMSLLHDAAAIGGNSDFADFLIKKGVDPILLDNEGKTAMEYAASLGHVDFLKEIDAAIPRESKTLVYTLCFMQGLNRNRGEVVKWAAQKLGIDTKQKGYIMDCIIKHNLDQALLLVDSKEISDDDVYRILYEEKIHLFLALFSKIDINKTLTISKLYESGYEAKMSPLGYATYNKKNEELFETLLYLGANVNERIDDMVYGNISLIQASVIYGNSEAFKNLEKHGAILERPSNGLNYSKLYVNLLRVSGQKIDLDVFSKLIKLDKDLQPVIELLENLKNTQNMGYNRALKMAKEEVKERRGAKPSSSKDMHL